MFAENDKTIVFDIYSKQLYYTVKACNSVMLEFSSIALLVSIDIFQQKCTGFCIFQENTAEPFLLYM